MVMSRASTVKDYLAELPEDRRKTIAATRALVRKHLPKGYQEMMLWGMITWVVPQKKLRDTYNGQPLCPHRPCRAEELHDALSPHRVRQQRAIRVVERRVQEGGEEVRHGEVVPPLQVDRRHCSRGRRQSDRERHARSIRRDISAEPQGSEVGRVGLRRRLLASVRPHPEKEIDEKRGRLTIVSDQIGHQRLEDVRVAGERRHLGSPVQSLTRRNYSPGKACSSRRSNNLGQHKRLRETRAQSLARTSPASVFGYLSESYSASLEGSFRSSNFVEVATVERLPATAYQGW